jgi:hypothetical protein
VTADTDLVTLQLRIATSGGRILTVQEAAHHRWLPRNDELVVIPPWCAGLSLRPRQHERSSPDAHEPGRERAAFADLCDAARASPSRLLA